MQEDTARGSRWEEQALQRSLATARARSESQSRRLVEAARELAAEGGPAFTVQQVAERAGVSLKTLYRSFAGKDALLLAVFEEDNRLAADLLAQAVNQRDAFADRLHAFVTTLFDLATSVSESKYVALVMREYFRLSQEYATEVRHVLSPFVELLVTELERAPAPGEEVLGDVRRQAAAVFLLVVSHLCPLVLTDEEDDAANTAEFVFSFCLRALGMNPSR